ncbi:hypothetical protein AK812_SmicGene13458 [Symbiodinium microadriaticum]|uniref:Uncharacterized protein n=1 Tax=Symbiodinium microadriaticum TaxID=2951 RepID=A0A1Q9E837_SYMMI|nr:hypothetical protein AK812_SmicGene13458 [Symbiodinium microadriaticum]
MASFHAILLACYAVIGCQAKVRAVISVDLARFYSRVTIAAPKTALAVAYLLHEPNVQVLALASGFGLSRNWYQRLLLKHPCTAAEMFLADLQRQEVPVVCGLTSGTFLQRSTADDVLDKLMAGSGDEPTTWLVLDSMISEFAFAGPGLRWLGAESGSFLGAPGLMLRSWQDSLNEVTPRLRLVRISGNSTLDKEIGKCRGSWMAHHYRRAPFVSTIQQQISPMAWKFAASSNAIAATAILGLVSVIFPQDDDAPLLAAAVAEASVDCAAVSLEGQTQVSPEVCREERREDPPDTVYVKLQDVTERSLMKVVSTLCDVAPSKVAEGALKEAHGESYLRTVYAVRMEMAARLAGEGQSCAGQVAIPKLLLPEAGVEEIKKAHRARVAGLAQALSRFQHSAEDAEVAFGESLDLSSAADLRGLWRSPGPGALAAEELPKLLKDALERRDVPKLREAMSDMSKDGPKNIDGAEEAKKMIKRFMGSYKYQIRARALDHAVGERKISSIQAALATWDFSRDDVHAVKVLRKDGPHLQQVTQEWEFDRTDEDYQQAMAALRRYDKLVEDVERNVLDNWEWSKGGAECSASQGWLEVAASAEPSEAIRAAVEEAEFMRTEAVQEVQVPGDEDALQAPQENVLMFSTTGLPPKEYELRTLVPSSVDNWPFSLDDPTLQMAVPPRIYHKFIKLPENIVRGKVEEALMREATMQAVGAMSLGVEPDDLMMAGRIPTLRAASKPPRVVHGIMETICHCVAGIHPVVRDPPRDTGWRIENLTSLPDWVAVRRQSILAGQFLLFLEQTFVTAPVAQGFYELLSLANVAHSVAPEKRRGAHAIARDADAQRLSDLQAKGSLASDMLFSAAASSAILPGRSPAAVLEAQQVEDALSVERARLQVMEALAVTSVSNAVCLATYAVVCGLLSARQGTVKGSVWAGEGAELGAKARIPPFACPVFPTPSSFFWRRELFDSSEASLHRANKSIEVDVLIIRLNIKYSFSRIRSEELVHRIEAAMLKIAQCSQLDLDMPSLLGGRWPHVEIGGHRVDAAFVVAAAATAAAAALPLLTLSMVLPSQCMNGHLMHVDCVASSGRSMLKLHSLAQTSLFESQVALLPLVMWALEKSVSRNLCIGRQKDGLNLRTTLRPGKVAQSLVTGVSPGMPYFRTMSHACFMHISGLATGDCKGAQRSRRVDVAPVPDPRSAFGTPHAKFFNIDVFHRQLADPAICLIYGTSMFDTTVLALTAAFCFRQTFCEDSSPSDRNEIVGESVEANLSTSLRLLQELEEAGLPASYQVEFIEQRRRSAAFLGSIPTTPGTPETKPGSRHSDRDRDLQFGRRDTSSESRRRDNTMDSVSPPPVREADYQRGLHAVSAFVKAMKAANLACNQLQAMAEQGIPIVYPHVECPSDSTYVVRLTVADLAALGSPFSTVTLLDSARQRFTAAPHWILGPPAAEPAQRLRWAEGIMSVQLAPLPSFDQTLKRIARCIDEEQLAELAANAEPPENMQRGALGTGIERLFDAA